MDPAADRLARETLDAARKARDAREAYEALVADLALFLGLEADECRAEDIDIDEIKDFSEDLAGTKRDLRFLERKVKRGVVVGSRTRALSSRRPLRARGRDSHRGRAGHRRTTRSRAGPSSSDDPPGEQPPAAPRLTLAPKKALLTFGALALDRDLWQEVNR